VEVLKKKRDIFSWQSLNSFDDNLFQMVKFNSYDDNLTGAGDLLIIAISVA